MTRIQFQRRRSRDRGSATLELVLIFPIVLTAIAGGITAALFFHARNVAQAAAQEGLREATAVNGTGQAGEQRARQFIDNAGGNDILRNVTVTRSVSANWATVTVQGRSLTLLPGVNLPVEQSATGPVERFTD